MRSGASRPGCRRASTPGRRRSRVDSDGNPISPRFDRLLFFDVNGTPDARRTRGCSRRRCARSSAATRGVRPGCCSRPAGGRATSSACCASSSPIPHAKGLSDFELPAIDDYDLCLHLACDDEQRLAAIEAALLHGAPLPGADGLARRSRARCAGARREPDSSATGLPAAHQHVGGIPPGNPVAPSAPLFMGFKSGLRKNQATEDDVTIPSGPFAGGTTMQVSYMRLRLDSWYDELSERERVARMYAPQVTPEQVAHFTTDAESDPNLLGQAINRYGVIGHAQTSARARRNGKPLIIRRDFNTVDGGQAGLHFVSVQRTIEDFITTRNAMNASQRAAPEPGDHRHRQQRHQRVHLRPQARQLHPAAARRPLVPAAAGVTLYVYLRKASSAAGLFRRSKDRLLNPTLEV